jgi:transposase InsO family protein
VDKDSRWQCDIIDNIKDPAQQGDKTYRYVLLCVDVFTRYAWAEPMEARGEAAIAFARILQRAMENNHQPPTVLSTDKDAVFTGRAFQLKLREHDIVHVLKQSREDIAVVDRLISTVRRALAVNVKAGDENWVERLDEVMQGYNESPHRKLFGQAPVDIPGRFEAPLAYRPRSRPRRGPAKRYLRSALSGGHGYEAQRDADR